MTAFLWLLLVLAFTAWSVFLGMIVGDILKSMRLEAEHRHRETQRIMDGLREPMWRSGPDAR